MTNLRILKTLHGAPPDTMGGAGLVAGVLAQALQELGCSVTLAHPGARGTTSWRGVALRGAGARRPPSWTAGWRGDPDAADRLLDAVRPDILHVHHLSGWPLDLPIKARERGIRVVLTLHDYAVPCARGQLVDRAGRPCAGPTVRRCTRCLAPHLGIADRLLRAPMPGAARSVSARLATAADALMAAHVRLAPSADLARRMSSLGAGPVHVHPIPLPAPVAPAPPPGSGPVRFLYCSSLIPTKGAHLLLAAFSRLPVGAARLTLAGPAPSFAADPGYAARLGRLAERTEGVNVPGAIDHPSVPSVLGAHDVLVVPSIWSENSPLIVREATAGGLRTILPAHGGSRELDPDAQLVDTRAPDAEDLLAEALLAECARGRKRRRPLPWPTPLACARSLLERWYATVSTQSPRTD